MLSSVVVEPDDAGKRPCAAGAPNVEVPFEARAVEPNPEPRVADQVELECQRGQEGDRRADYEDDEEDLLHGAPDLHEDATLGKWSYLRRAMH